MSNKKTEKNTAAEFFSQRLKAARESTGLSGAAFARKMNIQQPVYHRYENGRFPDVNTVAALARELNVTVDWLLGSSESQYKQGGHYIQGPWQRVGPISQRELLFYREVSEEYLQKDLEHAAESLPKVPQGRARLHQISKIHAIVSELAWREQERITGNKRPLPKESELPMVAEPSAEYGDGDNKKGD